MTNQYQLTCLFPIGPCGFTPINPDGLNATGGLIPGQTENVMIECSCNGARFVTLFSPNMTTFGRQFNTPVGDPYFNVRDATTVVTLVIPTFSNSTVGVYTCGIGNVYPPDGMVTINLILGKD